MIDRSALYRTQAGAVVSSDNNEYSAAKKRAANAHLMQRLNKRVNDLEECVKFLSEKLRKLDKNDN